MGLAPSPGFPENADNVYERKIATPTPGRKGPLRFEEGLATDTDIPNDFQRGMAEATRPAPGSQNHVDPAQQYKSAQETMQERAHLGSASWVDSLPYLSEFAGAAMKDYNEPSYDQIRRSGGRYERPSPTVTD